MSQDDYQEIEIDRLRVHDDLIIKLNGIIEENMGFIAGGCARYYASPNDEPGEFSDVDIFCQGKDLEAARTNFMAIDRILNRHDCTKLHTSPNALTYAYQHTAQRIQLIVPFENPSMKTFGEPCEVMDQFDFTVVKAAFKSLTSTKMLVHKNFMEDEKAKRLIITHINSPIAVAQRVVKYGKKGYFCPLPQMIKLFNDWSDRSDEYKDRMNRWMNNLSNLTEEDFMELEMALRLDEVI